MDPDARQQKRRDIVLSSLNVAIETFNLAKEISSITPAKAVFGSVSVILTTIKVGFLLCVGRLRADKGRTGLDDQRGGLCRTWDGLRRCLHCPRPGGERKAVERAQRLRMRGNQPADDVSHSVNCTV